MASAQLPSNNKNGVLRSIGAYLLFYSFLMSYVPVFHMNILAPAEAMAAAPDEETTRILE